MSSSRQGTALAGAAHNHLPAKLAVAGPSATALCDRARDQLRAGQRAEARDTLVACLQSHPDSIDAYLLLAQLLCEVGFCAEARACLEQAAACCRLGFAERMRLGAAFCTAGAHEIGARYYRSALELDASHVGAWNELGLALAAGGEQHAAAQAFRAAIERDDTCAEPHANLASLLQSQTEWRASLAHYRCAVERNRAWPEVWNNLGICARAVGLASEAVEAFRNAIALRPDYLQAHYNLGNALVGIGDAEGAARAYREALRLDPSHAESLYSLANLTREPAAAARLYAQALSVRREFPEALVGLACAKLKACDWDALDILIERIHRLVREEPGAGVSPFLFLQLSQDPALQQHCARNWTRNRVEPISRATDRLPARNLSRSRPRRLRLGYLSPDLRNHAVGNLLAGLFERHDRNRFEVLAFSTGPDDGSQARCRAQGGVDRFIDARGWPSVRVAQEIHACAIDVLIDLGGYTEHSASEALVLRPAPIQVSYLGFPGTLGAPFIDYIVVDRYLVPDHAAQCYDECPVYLPDCYQPLPAGERLPTPPRAALGLPEGAFVFCCFNQGYKIQPALFDAWMRILREVPGSVLWMAAFAQEAVHNLRAAAASRKVNPERLVFAPIVSPAQHRARLSAADLFLDTLPYSAGATASQTLQAGVPILSIVGSTYVGRMSSSLLHAAGMDELCCQTIAEYERDAVALANDRARTHALRERLAQGVQHLPDEARFARHLEQSFDAMWQRLVAGEAHRGQPPICIAQG